MNQFKQNKMAVMPMGKLVFNMSIPMIVSLLIQSLYNIVDSIFVAKVSEYALTATAYAYPVQMLMIAVGVGTAVGLNAILSKTLGAGKSEEASQIATTGVLLALISGLIFTCIGLFFGHRIGYILAGNSAIGDMCADYLWLCMTFCIGNIAVMMYQRLLQATGRTGLSMVCLVAGAVTNMILDPILIFGLLGFPRLEVTGAAISTVIGQWMSLLVGIFLNARYNPDIHISFHGFHLNPGHIKSIYKVALPTIIMQAMTSMMVTCFNSILQPFSSTAVAFFGVYYKLQNFLFMPMNGLGQASIPIIGFSYGAKNKSRITQCLKVIYPVGIIIALIGTAIFSLFPSQLLSLFSAGSDMLVLGIPALRIISATFALASVTILTGYVASGLSDGITNMLAALLRQFVPLIPLAWIFAKNFGIDKVWYSMWISEIISLMYILWKLHRLIKQKL